MSERKLKAWEAAGLVDAETAGRIRAWEAAHSRPLGLWAIIGLGAMTVGLGIVSVVAANWDAIPGEVRLAVHFAAMAGMAALLWWQFTRETARGRYFSDALLLVAAVLGLTFLAHVGQVYQTSSPLWQPLLLWLLIFTPLLLMLGRGWPVAGLWLAGVLGTALAHAGEYEGVGLFGPAARPLYPALYWGLISCPPMAVAASAAWMRARSGRVEFWRLLEQLSLCVILGGASLLIIASGWSTASYSLAVSAAIRAVALTGAAAAIYSARRTPSAQAVAIILAVAAALHLSQAGLIDLRGVMRGPWINALLFVALWGTVAAAALFARWRRVFQVAIALVAGRIIILSFELGGDLLGSGVQLILSGGFAMMVAWATVRISKRYAPAREDGA